MSDIAPPQFREMVLQRLREVLECLPQELPNTLTMSQLDILHNATCDISTVIAACNAAGSQPVYLHYAERESDEPAAGRY